MFNSVKEHEQIAEIIERRQRSRRIIRTLLEGADVRVGRHRRRVSEGMTGMRECPRDPTSMRRPRRVP
jgi:hypothetical protein